MKRALLSFIIFVLMVFPAVGHAAYASNVCKNSVCLESEVGTFMQGISQDCGNLGDCSLSDIRTVFANIGNFVVGIIGGLVLLMYVVGGFYWLTSAGNKERVDKGKKYMTISTVGLLIVMFSYLIIYGIRGSLTYGTLLVENEYYACVGEDTLGKQCDINSTCTENGCESECRQVHPGFTTAEEGIFTIVTYHDCIDTSDDAGVATDENEGNLWYDPETCYSGYCPGDSKVVCCQVHMRY